MSLSREDQFAIIVRAYYAEKSQGRKPYRSLAAIGREEFGFTTEEANRIRMRTAFLVRRGLTSDDMMNAMKVAA